MRRLALVLGLAACRQALGIPGEGHLGDDDGVPRIDVTLMPKGVVGASAPVGIDVALSDGSSEHVDLSRDEPVVVKVRDRLAYTITGPSICTIDNGMGVVLDGHPPPPVVNIACDGVAALADPGFSAPILDAFAGSGSAFALHGSFLVQETSLTPAPRDPASSLVVALGGAPQTASAGTWGPFSFTDGTSIQITSSYAPAFVRSYAFTATEKAPAAFGYGKAAAPVTGSRFGSAIAADHEWLVVGAPGPANASGAGRAYVFRRTSTTWTEEAILQAPSPTDGDNFGASVALRDGLVVIGAPHAGTAQGSAYVFVRDGAGTWSGAAVASPTGDGVGFGSAVAIDLDYILIGAARANNAAGAVYQYDLGGTSPQLFAAGLDAGDRFGASIAARNGTVVIGAPGEASSTGSPSDNGYPAAGAAYIYTDGAGSTATYLKAPAPAPGDELGAAVATNGTDVVVGAPFQDSSAPLSSGIDPAGMVSGGAPQSGAVYMWKRAAPAWTFAHTLKAPNTGAGDGFGTSISFVRDVLAIGAPFEDSSSPVLAAADEARHDAGAVYAYALILGDVTQAPAYIKAATPGVDDAFGSALALSLESLVVGAPYDNSAATGWTGAGGDWGADAGAVSTYR